MVSTGLLHMHNTFLMTELSHWQRLVKKLLVWQATVTFGSSKLNCSWQYFMTSMLLVLEYVLMTKLMGNSYVMLNGQATRPYIEF